MPFAVADARPKDFTWDGVRGYAQILHEPSLLTLRHHVNATMVHLALSHAAQVELAEKHEALSTTHADLAVKHDGLIALYTDLAAKHKDLGAKYAKLEGKVGELAAVQGALFDVSVSVTPKPGGEEESGV